VKKHPKHLPADERRAVTVESVVEQAGSQNPSGITTAAIAKLMNLTQGALFRHFPNKETIRRAVMEWVAEHPGEPRMMFGELQRAESTPAKRMVQTLIQRYRERLHRLIEKGKARAKALELLTALDVQHRARSMPSQLSGGEQQRVVIARGLVNRPPVILADEPTATLDSERALAVIRNLNDMACKFETAIIVVTHDEKIIPPFKRIYHIRYGVTHEEAGEGRGFE